MQHNMLTPDDKKFILIALHESMMNYEREFKEMLEPLYADLRKTRELLRTELDWTQDWS